MGYIRLNESIFNGEDILYFKKLINYFKINKRQINKRQIEKWCLKITSLILPIGIIDTYIYKKWDLLILYIISSITSITYHHNLYKYGQILDRTCIRLGTIYVYLNYFLYHKKNLKFLSFFIFSGLLYIPSMYYNSNIIHSILHMCFLYSSLLVNRTKYIR